MKIQIELLQDMKPVPGKPGTFEIEFAPESQFTRLVDINVVEALDGEKMFVSVNRRGKLALSSC